MASRTTRLGQPEINLGIIPGAGGTQRLLRTIGKYRTALLTLTGEAIDAQQAYIESMISELCDEGRSLERPHELATKISSQVPLAVASIKDLLNKGEDVPLLSMLKLERATFIRLFDSADQKKGMSAFSKNARRSTGAHSTCATAD